MSVILQPSFAAGEVAPELHGRVDQSLYHVGLKEATNMVVASAGGISNRPGFRYVGPIKNQSQGARLETFRFSAEDNYILEFGHRYLRIIRDDRHLTETPKAAEAVTRSAPTHITITGHGYNTGDHVVLTSSDIDWNGRWAEVRKSDDDNFTLRNSVLPNTGGILNFDSRDYNQPTDLMVARVLTLSTDYDFADLFNLKLSQFNDLMTITHEDYKTYDLVRKGETDWEIRLTEFGKKERVDRPTFLMPDDSFSGSRPRTLAQTLKIAVRVYRDDALAGSWGLWGYGLNIVEIERQASGLHRVYYNAPTDGEDDPASAFGLHRMPDILHTTERPAGFDPSAVPEISSTHRQYPYSGLEAGDVVYLAGMPASAEEIEGRDFIVANVGATGTPYFEVDLDGARPEGIMSGNVYLTVWNTKNATGATGGFVYTFQYPKINSLDDDLNYEVYAKFTNDEEWALAARKSPPEIFRTSGRTINRQAHYDSVPFTVTSTAGELEIPRFANLILLDDFEAEESLFGVGQKPGVVGYYQQRRVVGATGKEPSKLFYSQIGNYSQFQDSQDILEADAPITATLVSGEQSRIRHLVSLTDLVVLTDTVQWQVRSGGAGFSAATMQQRPQARVGASEVRPVVFDDTIIYPREGRKEVVGISFSEARDSYTAVELSLLSRHLFNRSPVVDMAGTLVPERRLFCVTTRGDMAVLVYNPVHGVTAWTRWETRGLMETVTGARANLETGAEDVPYVVTRRVNPNGVVQRFIERADDRQFGDLHDAFFLDAGLTYDNPVPLRFITFGIIPGTETTRITTSSDHGLTTGDTIELSGLVQEEGDDFNLNFYEVTVINARDFDISVNSVGFSPYVSGGQVRKVITTAGGLHHLEGRRITALLDGAVYENLLVSDGKVTPGTGFARGHFGLPYTVQMETLNLEGTKETEQGAAKFIPYVTLRMEESLFPEVAVSREESLPEWRTQRPETWRAPAERDANGRWDRPANLFTGDVQMNLHGAWTDGGRIKVRQTNPVPFKLLALIPVYESEDPR